MISLIPVISHLRKPPVGFSGNWFRMVDGADRYARIRLDGLPLPGAWVIRASDDSQHAGECAENVTVHFDVVIAISNARVNGGQADTDENLLRYRLAVKDLLLGFELPGGYTPIKFAGGKAVEYSEEDFFWADRYVFSGVVTNYLPDPPAFGELVNVEENPHG